MVHWLRMQREHAEAAKAEREAAEHEREERERAAQADFGYVQAAIMKQGGAAQAPAAQDALLKAAGSPRRPGRDPVTGKFTRADDGQVHD